MEIYVGIDVSKDVLDVDLPSGPVRFAQTSAAHAALLQALPEGAIVVLEATGPYGLRLVAALQAAERPVCVVNPLLARRFAQSQLQRHKTDRADARVLTDFGQAMKPRRTAPTPEALEPLRQRQALLALLIKHLTALQNHLQALQAAPRYDAVAEMALLVQIAQLEAQIAELEAQLERDARAVNPDFERLLAVPGVGPKTALLLLLIGPGLGVFANARAAVAYAGLCPRHFESGSSVRARPRLSKLGNSRWRRGLYLAAWSAARYNPACKALYERLLERGKAKMQALCAVAACLLRQAWAIVKHDRDFDPAFHLQFGN